MVSPGLIEVSFKDLLSLIEASFKDLLVLSGTQHHFNIEIAEIKQRDIVSALFQCLNGIVCMPGVILQLYSWQKQKGHSIWQHVSGNKMPLEWDSN